MEAGSIEKFLVPWKHVSARMPYGSDSQMEWNRAHAAVTIVRMLKLRATRRSGVELPCAGIGDPG